jgi:uncharacterized protein
MLVLYLCVCGFTCAWCTAAFGAGGGMLLFPMLEGVLPIQALNPVHGVVQMSSNLHRLLLRYKEVDWWLVAQFGVGCVIGGSFSMALPLTLPEKTLLIALGVIVVSNALFTERFQSLGFKPSLWLAGLMQGFLGPYLGVIGGMTSSALLGYQLSHRSRATHIAATGFILNTSKTLVFLSWGISFSEWLPTVSILIVASLLGTWCGLRYGEKVEDQRGKLILKWIIVIAGLKMIATGLELF